jgi:hypothetical protein
MVPQGRDAMQVRHGVVGLSILLMLVPLLWVVVAVHQEDVPLYTARTVMIGLREHPRNWFGRTVAVRGIVRGSVVDQGVLKEVLLEPFPTGMQPPSDVVPVSVATQPLTILAGNAQQNPVLILVRRIPLLSGIVPDRQQTSDADGWGVYRIRIVDASTEPGCSPKPCYRATALDPVSGVTPPDILDQ